MVGLALKRKKPALILVSYNRYAWFLNVKNCRLFLFKRQEKKENMTFVLPLDHVKTRLVWVSRSFKFSAEKKQKVLLVNLFLPQFVPFWRKRLQDVRLKLLRLESYHCNLVHDKQETQIVVCKNRRNSYVSNQAYWI